MLRRRTKPNAKMNESSMETQKTPIDGLFEYLDYKLNRWWYDLTEKEEYLREIKDYELKSECEED